MQAPPETEGQVRCLSFRDPAGQLFDVENKLVRMVEPGAAPLLQHLLEAPTLQPFMESGSLIASRTLDKPTREHFGTLTRRPTATLAVEHERVWFQSFPQEWTPSMLRDAGDLTLNLAETLLKQGCGLKDATPQNVLFRGPIPVFVDWLSFERRNEKDLLWLPYAQFVRSFLTPLLLVKKCAMSLQSVFLNHRDGIDHDQAFHLIPKLARFLPPALGLISIPHWLSKRGKRQANASLYTERLASDPEIARFILARQFRSLRRSLHKVTPKSVQGSRWDRYMEFDYPYDTTQLAQKEHFIRSALKSHAAQTVLDAGCNTGHFSELAARTGAKVVGIDFDAGAVAATYARAKSRKLDILPLVVNLARPTPAVGWMNSEQTSFLERARGKFDLVLMLAVVHHLLLSEGVSLAALVDLMMILTRRHIVLEFVGPGDLSFQHLCRGRDFSHITSETFEAAIGTGFEIIHKERVQNQDRTLYLLKKRH